MPPSEPMNRYAYSWTDTAKFGVTMLVIGWLMIILWGETWMRWLGYTPNGVFGLF